MLLCAGIAPSRAADLVRVEMSSGLVFQGRLVGGTPQTIWLAIPGRGDPIRINRGEVRRYTVVQADQSAQPPEAKPRLPANERFGTIRLVGASSMGVELVPALLTEYGRESGLVGEQDEISGDATSHVVVLQGAESNRKLLGQIATRGTSETFADLAAGRADIGMSTRRATDLEMRYLLAGTPAYLARTEIEQVVGLSGVAIIVHRDNPLRALSIAQLRGIFAGTITRWPTGDGSTPINVNVLDRGTGEAELVRERILGLGAAMTARARVHTSHDDLADAVAADPNAIGFVEVGSIRNARALDLEQECGLVGRADPFHLRTEEYPLSGRFYLYTTPRAVPVAADVMRFAATARAQAALAERGFVDLQPLLASAEESSAQLQAAGRLLATDIKDVAEPRLRAMRQLLSGARRLSVTFRFDAGRSDLDARAEADLNRLRQWLDRNKTAQSALILVGHASPEGQFVANVDLSRLRAQAVAARLAQLGVNVEQVEGVGPVDQVLCGSATQENDMNRRVEVWIR